MEVAVVVAAAMEKAEKKTTPLLLRHPPTQLPRRPYPSRPQLPRRPYPTLTQSSFQPPILGVRPATVQAEAAAAETKTKESKIMEVALVAVVEAAAMPQESRGAAAEGQMKSLSPL